MEILNSGIFLRFSFNFYDNAHGVHSNQLNLKKITQVKSINKDG